MRAEILRAVVGRETEELLRNRLLVASIVIPPILLVAFPLIAGLFVQSEPLPPDFARQVIAQRPEWAGLDQSELTAAFTFQQFLPYFLMMPAYIPLSIATFSIVGEKQSRSLEAVLATPIRTIELLTGKALAALVPGVAAGWLTYGAFVVLAGMLYSPRLAAIVTDPSWLAGTFLLGPAIGLLSVVAGVIVSARVNDPRTAQQIGGVVIVPIVAISLLQASATLIVGEVGYALAAAGLLAVSVVGLRFGVRLFGRENILTRWR